MAILNWYTGVLKKYAVFTGRAGRSEYWYFVLVHVIILIALGAIDAATGLAAKMGGTGPLELIYLLGTLVPTIGVAIRRMHDVGKSGWFCLIPIYNIVLAATAGEEGENAYGPSPDNALA